MRRPTFRDFLPLWKQYVDNRVVWWKGDPQRKVLLPMFWMKVVKPSRELPPGVVQFHVHKQMSKFDIKQYLDKIYQVPVVSVSTAIHRGKKRAHPSQGYELEPEEDTKVAYVQLPDNIEFQFPNLFKDKQTDEDRLQGNINEIEKGESTFLKNKGQAKVGLPTWFR